MMSARERMSIIFAYQQGGTHRPLRQAIRMPGTSKPPTAFPLVGGPSSVSTQSAPGGIRTPNLLIRSNSIDPTRAEAARPQTRPGQVSAQVTGVRTRQGGPGRSVRNRDPRNFGSHSGSSA